MEKRTINKSKYVAAFALTAMVFLLILVADNYFNQLRMNKLDALYQSVRLDSLGAELQYQLISENPCVNLDYAPFTQEFYKISERLDFMEKQLGKNNQQVLDLKEYYDMLEIRHWLYLKKAFKDCNINGNLILYFYSNKGDCSSCENQGYVLSYIKQKHNNTYVYSFDTNLDNPALTTLKSTYNVTSVPSLVINDKTHNDFMDKAEIEALIKN